jgi:hypothetical protein
MSSEMDEAKSGLIRKALIKGRGPEIFSKFHPPTILWDPFEVKAPSRSVIGYY